MNNFFQDTVSLKEVHMENSNLSWRPHLQVTSYHFFLNHINIVKYPFQVMEEKKSMVDPMEHPVVHQVRVHILRGYLFRDRESWTFVGFKLHFQWEIKLCPNSLKWSVYAELFHQFIYSHNLICSIILLLKDLPVWPLYTIRQSLQVNL